MDYGSIIPSFDNILPDLLNQKNRLVLASDTHNDAFSDLAKALKKSGYEVVVVTLGDKPDVGGIPTHNTFEKAQKDGCVAVIMTKSHSSLQTIKDAIAAGIDRIWLEIGSETSETIEFLETANVTAVYQLPIAREALNPDASEAMKLDRKDS